MLIQVLKSKISYAIVTQKELFYDGSITIDQDWIDQAKLVIGEWVHVVNLNNGERLETYVIAGERGSRVIGLNGPAARKGEIGDPLFIISFGYLTATEPIPAPIVINVGAPKTK